METLPGFDPDGVKSLSLPTELGIVVGFKRNGDRLIALTESGIEFIVPSIESGHWQDGFYPRTIP